MTHITRRKRASRTPRRRPMTTDLTPGPRAATVKAILNYSKALKVVQLPPVGAVDIVLN